MGIESSLSQLASNVGFQGFIRTGEESMVQLVWRASKACVGSTKIIMNQPLESQKMLGESVWFSPQFVAAQVRRVLSLKCRPYALPTSALSAKTETPTIVRSSPSVKLELALDDPKHLFLFLLFCPEKLGFPGSELKGGRESGASLKL
jgi:hypothetical protein